MSKKLTNKRIFALNKIGNAGVCIQRIKADTIVELLNSESLNAEAISKMYEIASNRDNIVPINAYEL
jgi:hypothetical protein|tara:strand:- start:361 stop:561 length:201 start_codon:yes stop_codon:yes gene_type:complete